MRMSFLGLFAAMLLLGSFTPIAAHADEDAGPNYVREGWYVTFSALRANENFSDDAVDSLYSPDTSYTIPDGQFDFAEEHFDFNHCHRFFFGRCRSNHPHFSSHDHFKDLVVPESGAEFSAFHDITGDFSDSMGLGAAIGWRLNRNFAYELRVERFNGFRSQGLSASPEHMGESYEEEEDAEIYPHNDLDLSGHTLRMWTLTSNAKAFYPLMGDRLQPFALAGLGVVNGRLNGPDTSGSETEFMVRYGVGADYYLTENIVWGMEAAHNIPTGDLRGFDFWTVGTNLTYRF